MRVEVRLLRFQQLVLDDGRGLGYHVRFVEGQMRVEGARLVRCLMRNDTSQDQRGEAQVL